MDNKSKHSDISQYRLRLALIGSLGTLTMTGLLFNLAQIQIKHAHKYRNIAKSNHIRLEREAAPRAIITDRYGVILADNAPRYQAFVDMQSLKGLSQLKQLLQRVQLLDGLEALDVQGLILTARSQPRYSKLIIIPDLTRAQLNTIQVNWHDLQHVDVEKSWKRVWPFKDMTSHIIGYVTTKSDDKNILPLTGQLFGRSGFEKSLDSRLQGVAKQQEVERMADGRRARVISTIEAKINTDIASTIDIEMQKIAWNAIKDKRRASVVLMDLSKGDVLALANIPSYDANDLSGASFQKSWNSLLRDPAMPLFNRATSGLYSPGSTFKLVSALAAMQAGVAENFKVHCKGYIEVGSHRFHCWHKKGHGEVGIVQAIAQSCDVWFYEVARMIGINAIAKVAKICGLGEPRKHLGLPSKQSIIPDENWKQRKINQPWYTGDTLNSIIGQGYVLTTPLDLCVMVARIGSGNFSLEPRLIKTDASQHADVTLKQLSSEQANNSAFSNVSLSDNYKLGLIRKAMEMTITGELGTARGAAIRNPSFEMAGKTGSAQVRRITLSERELGVIKQKHLPWSQRDHALFVGYAPIIDPKYCVSVIIEHGISGASVAAPIARDLLLAVQKRRQND